MVPSLLSLDKYISRAVTVCSFIYLFLLCYENSRSSMTLLIVSLGNSGWHTCHLVIYYTFIEYLQYLPDESLFYFERKSRVRVVMLVLYTFATSVAEKYVYTCSYVTSASFSDDVFRLDGAACLRNMQLCLLVRCSLCLVLLSTFVPLFNISNIVVYISMWYPFTCIFHAIYLFSVFVRTSTFFRCFRKIEKSDC